MMLQTEECEIVQHKVRIVMIKVGNLTSFHLNVAVESETNATATARKQDYLILNISGNGDACHSKFSC